MLRHFALSLVSLGLLVHLAVATPGDLPHPEEAAVAKRIIERSGVVVEEKAPPGWAINGLRSELASLGIEAAALTTHGFVSKDKPQNLLWFALNSDGRVIAIRGNGPWLTNASMTELVAMPELRIIGIDHNGSTKHGPENDFDGSGLGALANSKLLKVKLGLSFSDRGMAAAAQIVGLRVLHVIHSETTEAGIDALAGHPALEDFVIAEMAGKRVTPAALAKIPPIPKLTRLGFRECYVTYAGGLEFLKPMAGRLKEIDLRMCLVSEADLALLKRDHPEAEVKTMTPAEIAKTHKAIAANLVKQAPPELADPLRRAMAEVK